VFGFGASLLILAASIVAVAASQLIAKWRLELIFGDQSAVSAPRIMLWTAVSDGWLWLAAMLIVASAVCWYAAMTRLPLTLMMPMAGAIAPIVAVAAFLLFKEPLSATQFAAIVVIALGVIWLGIQQ
jgi:drug/metabolite transporter (DMT)-like permease